MRMLGRRAAGIAYFRVTAFGCRAASCNHRLPLSYTQWPRTRRAFQGGTMRRLTLLLAAAAVAATGVSGTAQAQTGICVGRICVCVQVGACTPVEPDGRCVRVDLDNDGDYEQVCTGRINIE